MSDPYDLFGADRKTLARLQSQRDTHHLKKLPPPPWGNTGQLGHFSLLRFVAMGGGSYVYIARDEKAGTTSAVKIIPVGLDQIALQQRLGFRRMMLVDHPNLLKVDRIHLVKEYNVLAMEEIQGDTLLAWAKQTYESMKPGDAERVFEKILTLIRDYAAGLAEMHTQGLLHRDIKPANLMVTPEGKGVIIDYGCVSHCSSKPRAQSIRQIGTRGYIAPEVFAKRMHFPASDIYSLGMVLHACLHYFSSPYQPDPTNDLASGDTASQHSESPLQSEKRDSKSDEVEQQETETEVTERHQLTLKELADMPSSIPELLRETCVEMLDFDPNERPTAVRLARLGLPMGSPQRLAVENPLLGRDSELQAMIDWAQSVSRGHPSRLNLSGESCMGKTRLITEFLRELESNDWAQVFVGRCRAREDAPFQALAQICDAIVERYLSLDRERIKLDASSTQILCELFPSLRRVIDWDKNQYVSRRLEPTRADGLSAARAMCVSLVEIGPLFIIIDDAQWADRDSLHTLDYLRTMMDGLAVGIVTASRLETDLQRVPADLEIRLSPLSSSTSLKLLQKAAERHRIKMDPETLRQYALSTNGNPFRLKELASELCPGGLLDRASQRSPSDSDPDGVRLPKRFWKRRFDLLSDGAQQILLLVATGGVVAIQQLKDLSGLGDAAEAAVTELTRARLVQDDVTGGECISPFHDRIAEELIESFGEEKTQGAHAQWAEHLSQQNSPRLAARIAGHLFQADRPHQAVGFTVQAAENADQLIAPAEAGRWYSVAADHSDGHEQLSYLLKAAKCYEVAEQPRSASQCYNRAVDLLEPGEERYLYLRQAVTLSIRSGDFCSVRDNLCVLATQLNIPAPKPVWQSKLGAAISILKLIWSRRRKERFPDSVEGVIQAYDLEVPHNESTESAGDYLRNRMRLEVCLQLARPNTLFDNPYSLELILQAALLVSRFGDDTQRVHVAAGQAVFQSYGGGQTRAQSERTLFALQQYVENRGSLQSKADVSSCIACVYVLATRWKQLEEHVVMAIKGYESDAANCRFEIAHTSWMELWSTWHCGRWGQLVLASRRMTSDASQRGDLFQLRITCSGFGIGAWLADDKLEEYDRVWQRMSDSSQTTCLDESLSLQLFDVFECFSQIMRLIYEGDFQAAWECYVDSNQKISSSHFSSMQMPRIIMASFQGLMALHLQVQSSDSRWEKQVLASVRDLRAEQEPYPQIMADFYEGMMLARKELIEGEGDHIEDCVSRLIQVSQNASQESLRPVELAAQDVLNILRQHMDGAAWDSLLRTRDPESTIDFGETSTPNGSRQLIERMQRRGVVAPEKLARLYTIDLSAIG